MAISEKCNARNRLTCRFHGALDHARIDLATAREKYDSALAEYVAADPETRDIPNAYSKISAQKRKVNVARNNVNHALAVIDAMPTELKKLKAEISLAEEESPESLPELKTRLKKAEELRAKKSSERKAEKVAKTAEETARTKNEEIFKRISGEAQNQKTEAGNDWKAGYKKAVSGVIAEQGSIVNGPGSSQYGIYMPDYDNEKTRHFKECGALDICNVKEHAWSEWDFNSMDDSSSSHEEFKVTADATCNCGQITCEQIQVSGTFSDITRQVLDF